MISSTPEIKLHAFPFPSPVNENRKKDTVLIDSKKPDTPEEKTKIDKKIFAINQ